MSKTNLEIALDSFFETRKLSYDLLDYISNEMLNLPIPRTCIKTIGEQIAEMAEVSIAFSESIETHFLSFINIKWQYPRKLVESKKALIESLNNSDRIILDSFNIANSPSILIDIYGKMQPPIDVLIGLIQHETLHIGQLSICLHYNNIELPESWQKWMMCENQTYRKVYEEELPVVLEEIIVFQKRKFKKYANKVYAEKEKKYTKSNLLFWGVKKDIINKLAKEIKTKWELNSTNNLMWLLNRLWASAYHEDRTLAVVLSYTFFKYLDVNSFNTFENWLKEATSWGQVDELCIKTIGVMVIEQPTFYKQIFHWCQSEFIWLRRASLLAHLHSIRKNKPNIELISKTCIFLLKDENFFIQKAIGWTLRELSSFKRNFVIDFVNQNSKIMSKISIKEATRKF